MQPQLARWICRGSRLGGLTALCLLLATCAPVSPSPTGGSPPGAVAPASPVTATTLRIGTEPVTATAGVPDQWALWTAGRAATSKATTGLFLQKSALLRRVELSTLTLSPPQADTLPLEEAEIILHNATAGHICYVYISPTDADSWGDDRLGGEETIPPGGERAFLIAPGHYDLRADDCDGAVVDDVRAVNVQVQVLWAIRGDAELKPDPAITPQAAPTATPTRAPTVVPRAPTPVPTPVPTPTPRQATLTEFLCCGQTAGETRIWGIGYPGDWRAETVPANSQRWLAAIFTSPADDIRILIAPSAWTPMGTPMDVGDVDQYLNAVGRDQAARSSNFAEFMRRPVPGVPNARIWSATWWEGDRQFYATYLVMVNALPYVEQLPRGTLMALGFQAEAAQWRFADTVYAQMLGTLQVEVVREGPAYVAPSLGPTQSPEAQGVAEAGSGATSFWELLFCPKACAWEYVDIANQPAGQIWECSDGCIGQLSEVPCGQCY